LSDCGISFADNSMMTLSGGHLNIAGLFDYHKVNRLKVDKIVAGFTL